MLTTLMTNDYAELAGAKSSARFGDLNYTRRTGALRYRIGAFFASIRYVMDGLCGETFVSAGFRVCRFANPAQSVLQSVWRQWLTAPSSIRGVRPMAKSRLFLTLIPSKRAAAHRAMAKAALFTNASASARLKRYNHHIEKACRLEAAVVGQEVQS